jgi:hypothetical protein
VGGVQSRSLRVLGVLFVVAGATLSLAPVGWAADEPSAVRKPGYDASGVIVPRDDSRETPRPQDGFTEAACMGQRVWRLAGPNDRICVLPHAHARVAKENADGPSHVAPGGGAYGAETCLPGFVWRDAFPGDHVCVTPDSRRLADWENISDKAERAN